MKFLGIQPNYYSISKDVSKPKFPGTDESIDCYNTMWPIYFYHDGSREWVKMKQIVFRFDTPEYLEDFEKSYNHRLFQKRVPNPQKEWVLHG